MADFRCSFCGEPLDPQSQQTWRKIEGWERKASAPSRKAGSDIALREPLDEYAHSSCVRLTQQGIAVGQGSLL